VGVVLVVGVGLGEVVLRMAIHQVRLQQRLLLVLLHGHHVDRPLGGAGVGRLFLVEVAAVGQPLAGEQPEVEFRQVEEAEEQVVEVVTVELRLLLLIALVDGDVLVRDVVRDVLVHDVLVRDVLFRDVVFP
jgi:hypothetical protein